MKTIITPTDFSPPSLNAVHYAADLAAETGSKLLLLHVYQMPVVEGDMPVSVNGIDRQIKEAEQALNDLKEKMTVRTGRKIEINIDVNTDGGVVAQIEAYVKSVKPSFVVMGSRGGSAVERLFFGSHTVTAMKQLSCPLIVVPPEAKFRRMTKIGFASDFRKVINTTPIAEVKSLVQLFSATLHVIHVNTEGENKYSSEIIEESGLLQEMFAELHPVYHFLNNVKIDEGLSEYAEKNNLDLLIVAPKKYTFVDRLFHKSQSKQLIIHTHVPVLSVHE